MAEKLIIEGFNQFGGKHCWTTSLKNVLAYHGLNLSEEMLFGLGGGVGFIYWYMKMMPAPFVGGRYGKGDEPLINTFKRIGGRVSIFETASSKKAYEELKMVLRQGEPAVVFVDMAYLPYMAFPEVAHFGGHTIIIYGLDEAQNKVYVADRSVKPLTLGIEDLEKARGSKIPPFASKNKLLKVSYPSKVGNLEPGIKESITESCHAMRKPPIKNLGLAGILKWAGLVPQWPKDFKGLNLLGCLMNVFIYIEIGGTGGSAFRPMYAQFLDEAASILGKPALAEVAQMFRESGKIWSKIATAALPDWWPSLKKIRELITEKNRIFEQQGLEALERMKEINSQTDYFMKEAVEELRGNNIGNLLTDMQQKILGLYEVEKQAFEKLSNIVQ